MRDFADIVDAQTLAQAIVNTIPEPFLVLDDELRVLAASRSFYSTFKVMPDDTLGTMVYSLGDGQWNIPALRELLETIIPATTAMDDFEVEHKFPGIGLRIMLLNARMVLYDNSPSTTILLAFRDVTERRVIEREKQELLHFTEDLVRQKQTLLQEMEHRVLNSLQIIASILMLKARAVNSDETRLHLQDAHQRVMSVAAVQKHLHAFGAVDQIEVGLYLTKLCSGLGSSMVGEAQPIDIKVVADSGSIESAQAVSIGLIVTELVINAIKYAFPTAQSDAQVLISYEIKDHDWKLTVSDNGVGKVNEAPSEAGGGLGTIIVRALVKSLGANMNLTSGADGTTFSIARGDLRAPN